MKVVCKKYINKKNLSPLFFNNRLARDKIFFRSRFLSLGLEDRVSSLMGKESGLFVVSGTMSNLLAMMTHCSKRGSEAYVGSKSHIFMWEQACMAQEREILIIE